MKRFIGFSRTASGLSLLPLCLLACSAAQGTEAEAEPVGENGAALTGTLQVHGRVTSPTGAPIAGVTLTLSGAAWKTTTTDSAGKYTFSNLAAGSYTVTPSKSGLQFCSASASLPKLRRNTFEDFSASTSGCQMPTHTKKVSVLIYDPNITKPDGTTAKLSVYKGWDDPAQLADQFRRSFESMTHGRVKYNIVKSKILNDFPVKEDGFDYTGASYLNCLANTANCHAADTANYLSILSSEGVCNAVNAGSVDELWIFGGPYFGFYESRLTGPKAFEYNSPPLGGSTCNKLLPIMGFNYERQLGEMVHDMLHRTEATMARVYGSWSQNRTATNWDRFGLIAAQSPNFGYSGCGTAHYAPNSTSDYDYANTRSISSNCDDFYNYPNLRSPAPLSSVTCSAWGCEELGYYRYFFQHLPKAGGIAPDTKFSDWWRYLMSPNDVFLTEPTVTCSSEYASGWCQKVIDGVKGSCNDGEWSTASLPTGWVKIQFPSARAVSSLSVYDRACDERVLAGHLEFSDGSANIAFGALENTGTSGTTLTFPTKNLSWVKLVIDQSSGVNPGIGEIVIR
ncbi:MAG: carboxypeptidase-like regulatory domain-containing protein [Myxococcota bacterium]